MKPQIPKSMLDAVKIPLVYPESTSNLKKGIKPIVRKGTV
jgi:hypothetical protein